jgi:hypothetical protein
MDEIEADTMLRMSHPARQHTTHHDDCGCKSARYEARTADLEAERDAARAASARLSEVLQETATEAADLRARLKIAEEELERIANDEERYGDWVSERMGEAAAFALAAIRKEGEG